MGLFNYSYIDAKGKKKSGFLEAETILEAKEKLRSQKTTVMTIKQASASRKRFFVPKTQILPNQHLIAFTTQLAELIVAGMPLYESLQCIEEQYRNESFQPILLSLSEQIKKGKPFSEALGSFPESFSPLYCSMIAAGEAVGSLDTSLKKLAFILSKQRTLKKQITTALLYPFVLFCFSLLVCLLLLTFVIPSLEALFEDRAINGFTELVIGISHFLTRKWPYYVTILSIITFVLSYLSLQPKFRILFQKSLLSLPLVAPLLIQAALARFSRTMTALLEGGVSLLQALQTARPVMQSPLLEEVIMKAESKIIEGSFLSHELKKSPLIPPLVTRLLFIGEESGNAAQMFGKIADLYEEEVEKMLSRITALAQPVILVFMGAVVGLIMLAVLLPLTDINAFI